MMNSMPAPVTGRARVGFTLLEVMLALAILAGSMMVLVGSQTTAVLMTTETEKLLTATMLAREKMAEVQVMMELEGFGDSDLYEEGDFDDLGGGMDDMTVDMNLEVDDAYDEFQWAWTVREIELDLGTDIAGMGDQLADAGFWGDTESDANNESEFRSQSGEVESPGLDDMGISADMVTDLLGAYIREVRVLVWWGQNEDGLDQVELVSHIINPSGMVSSSDEASE